MRTTGPPFPAYTPVGVHSRCSTLDLYKKLGGILTSLSRLNARFLVPLTLYNLLFSCQIFWSHKLFVSMRSHMFFLRIILVEGSCFLYYLIGDLEYTSVYTAVSGLVCPIKTSAHVYEQAFCNVLVVFLQISA